MSPTENNRLSDEEPFGFSLDPAVPTIPPAKDKPKRDTARALFTTAAGGAHVIEPPPAEVPPEAAPTSWAPMDLTDALAGGDVPPPTILTRTDGQCLVYAGRTHAFIGESESCKTWAALVAAHEVLDGGGLVLWVDYEDDERGLVSRLRALGVADEVIRTQIHYVRPEEPLENRQGLPTAGGADFSRLLGNHYTLAVIDGTTEGMVTEGLDPLATDAAAIWVRRLAKRLADTGAAVVTLDHVTKSSEGRGRYAIGSQHKIAGLTGAAYIFEVRRPLSRAVKDPVEASVFIKVSKDRPGHVRAGTSGSDQLRTVAVMELTAYPDGALRVRLVRSDEATGIPPADLLRRICEHLSIYPGSAKGAIEGGVGAKAERVRDALSWLVREGHVDVERSGVSHRHTLTDTGRELLDELP